MYYICQPKKIQLYINSNYKSAQAIKNELGCDIVLNGGLYDMSTFKAVLDLRADNKVYSMEYIGMNGYAWNDKDLFYTIASNHTNYKNFISCVSLIENSQKIEKLQYPSAMGGRRGRSAIGRTQNNKVILYCSKDGTGDAQTPESLRDFLAKLYVKDAIMLDGGGSSQCIFPNGSIYSSRIVQNYICVWINEPVELPKNINSFPEPTRTLRLGCKGEDVKWLQYELNKYGNNLQKDGDFGFLTYYAVCIYQRKHGLYVDGVCGPKTLEVLKGGIV